MPERLSYADSCQALKAAQIIDFVDVPRQPYDRPRHGDAGLGVRFFQKEIVGAKLEHLTLPNTFFSRSEFRNTSFRDSLLTECTANWNDFIEVDFTNADLSRSDLRACLFERVSFRGVKLVGVDFRYCGFKHCDFKDADLTDAKMTQKMGAALKLSEEQKSVIDWQSEEGEEPEGG